MTHFRNPTPTLETIEIRLELTGHGETPAISGFAAGRSSYQRRNLWTLGEVWMGDGNHGLEPVDWMSHVVLTALQDRPNTRERLDFGLRGGLPLQGDLF